MKKFNCIMLAALSAFCICCSRELTSVSDDGSSCVSLDTKSFMISAKEAGIAPSDIGSFMLLIKDPAGVAYQGSLSEIPDTVTVRAGNCSFWIRSRDYSGPEKDNPIYGDYLEKELAAGDFFAVDLSCRQLTCGVQVSFSSEFHEEYPDAFVRIMRRDTLTGAVDQADYTQNESGFCHFMPGMVTVNLLKDASSSPELLTGRFCSSADMFSVNLKLAPRDAKGIIKIDVDTLLVRYGETYEYGRQRTGKSVSDAVSPSDVHLFENDTVWVAGYITGCYVSKKFHQGIDSTVVSTNIALSSAADAGAEETVTIPVSVSAGVCKELNLKDHPAMLGQRVAVYGVAGTFYEQDGVKKSVNYVLL